MVPSDVFRPGSSAHTEKVAVGGGIHRLWGLKRTQQEMVRMAR